MGSFKTADCPPVQQPNYFTSGNYSTSSYTTSWDTVTVPDIDFKNPNPIYLQVLNKYGIPASFPDGQPSGGTLPGIDINNMDATTAIQFSLAESLLAGQWWEIREDNEGGVVFTNVFDDGSPGKTIILDVRLCIPSASLDNEVDMVSVTGYKAPPQVYPREFRDVVPAGTGNINPSILTAPNLDVFTIDPSTVFEQESLQCHKGLLQNSVTKSFKDPIKEGFGFGPQETNPFYDVKAFEELITYVVKIEGMPDSSEEAARVGLSFSDTTTLYIPITLPNFSKSSQDSLCSSIPQGLEIDFFEGSVTVNLPDFLDRYGDKWPFVISPSAILYTGHKVENILDTSALSGGSSGTVYINPTEELIRLDEGSQWIYSVNSPNQIEITFYYQPRFDADTWGGILSLIQSGGTKTIYSNGQAFNTSKLGQYTGFSSSFEGILGNTSDLGYLVKEIFLAVKVRRPSVDIVDSLGKAIDYADSLHIQYAPLIKFEPLEPVAYKHITEGTKIVDRTQEVRDIDPTTCQDFEETDLRKMQDLQTGNSISVSLPFCKDGGECLRVASTIFDYMTHNEVQTYVLTCGPNDEPELGAHVDGFPTNTRIQDISYSYQDGSSYEINVTLGPVFANVGSFNATPWLRETQEVTRDAKVVWSAGDGLNYRVQIQGLGEYYAVNATDETVFYVGEIVPVKLSNVPVEA